MRRDRTLLAVALGAVAVVSTLAVAWVARDRGEEAPAAPPLEGAYGLEALTTLSPRIVLFGDTVRAQVHVTLDRRRVDPDSVRVASDFAPWEVVGTPSRSSRNAGETVYVSTTFVLRCLTGTCVPPGQSAPLEFDDARVSFALSGDQTAARDSVRASWPLLLVYSRFAAANLEDSQATSGPWRVDLLSLPAASYRLAPGVLVTLLLASAVLAALAAAGLAHLAWPRRAPVPLPEPEPESPPEPALSPLEQALALLEESLRVNGAGDQRRALELVAEELELADWGDSDLARVARALAWSEDVPPVEETKGLAARVRSALPEMDEGGNGDGRVVV